MERKKETTWIWEENHIIKRRVTFIPSIYNLFEQMLLDAAHSKGSGHIKVIIDADRISVWCDGQGLKQNSNLKEAFDLITEFEVQKSDGENLTREVFTNNIQNPLTTITQCMIKEKSTRVSFKPSIECLKDDTFALMKRRVFDLAGSSTSTVELLGTVLPNKFQEYVDLYPQKCTDTRRIYEKVNNRWEISVGIADHQFEQVSFVNDVATMTGGSHVDCIRNQITEYLAKILGLQPNVIERYLWVFVNARIDDPTFDLPTIEKSTCQLKPEFLEKILDSHLLKNDVKELNVDKLVDAPLADSRYSIYSTLILVEGDTAKDFALSGLPLMGRYKYGVFPLKGKPLNVKDASVNKVKNNIEIQNIKKILGLKDGKTYKNANELRYGHLMVMADQDFDGSHIKGLLINLFHEFWQSLLEVNFLQTFVTPVIKAYTDNGVFSFYSLSKYETWAGNVGNICQARYFKGLGAIDVADAEELFWNCDEHIKTFVYTDEEDGNAIKLAFGNDKVGERKQWLDSPPPQDAFHDFDPKQKFIQIADFINTEYRQFARHFLSRSIPSIVDGFKTTQRKIIHGAFEVLYRNMKIESFAGDLIGRTEYHHGLMSLVKTIEAMCRVYVGSNNINLLVPLGQFGNKKKSLIQARYLDTELSPITRYIFHEDDECVLKYLYAFGGRRRIEPVWFIPIIPMVLVNGAEGIGFGWSSRIPNYNPREIIQYLQDQLEGKPPKDITSMHPWYKGYNGDIRQSNASLYTAKGSFIQSNPSTLKISGLPLITKEDYEEGFLKPAKEAKKVIEEYKPCNDDTGLFHVVMNEDQMEKARKAGILKKLKLITSLRTSNMHLFDANGQLKKHRTIKKIMDEFCPLRRGFYKKRKRALLRNCKRHALELEYKLSYIIGAADGTLKVLLKPEDERIVILKANGFLSSADIAKKACDVVREKLEEEEEEEEEAQENANQTGFEYLTNLKIGSYSPADLEKMKEELTAKNKDFDQLMDTCIDTLWLKDLKDLDKELEHAGYPKVAAKRARDAAGQSENKKGRVQ